MCSKLLIRLSTYSIHAAQWDWYYSDPTPALCGDNNSTMKNSASICTSMMPTVTELIVSHFKELLRNGRMTPLIEILLGFDSFLQKSLVNLIKKHEYAIYFSLSMYFKHYGTTKLKLHFYASDAIEQFFSQNFIKLFF